jgi:hypothetical protein
MYVQHMLIVDVNRRKNPLWITEALPVRYLFFQSWSMTTENSKVFYAPPYLICLWLKKSMFHWRKSWSEGLVKHVIRKQIGQLPRVSLTGWLLLHTRRICVFQCQLKSTHFCTSHIHTQKKLLILPTVSDWSYCACAIKLMNQVMDHLG